MRLTVAAGAYPTDEPTGTGGADGKALCAELLAEGVGGDWPLVFGAVGFIDLDGLLDELPVRWSTLGT